MVLRAEAWRDARQGLELALETGRRSRRLHVSLNAQVLAATLALNSTITSAQFVGAWHANSLALLIDCSSMLVDVISYAAALWAECSPGAKQRNEMIVSALSMLALWGVTLPAIVGALAVLAESERRQQLALQGITVLAGDEDDRMDVVNPWIILGFALAGIMCDAIALTCFCRRHRRMPRARPAAAAATKLRGLASEQQRRFSARGDPRRNATLKHARGKDDHAAALMAPGGASDEDEQPASPSAAVGADARGAAGAAGVASSGRGAVRSTDAPADVAEDDERDMINMRSALAHVVADSCRSVSTATAATLIIVLELEPKRTDAICSLVVAAVVISASVDVCKLWWRLACRDLRESFRVRRRRHADRTPASIAALLPSASAFGGEVGMHELSPSTSRGARSSAARLDPHARLDADSSSPARPRAVWHDARPLIHDAEAEAGQFRRC